MLGLLDLPNELLEKILQRSTASTVLNLVQCNKKFRHLFQSESDKRAAKQLMAYVLNPTSKNIAKAKVMYAANPRILFIETQGVEPASGIEENVVVYRKIIGSPFQAALGAGDSALYNDMATYFDKVVYRDDSGEVVETGIQRAQKQIQEKFPNGFDYPPSDYDFSEIVTAITNDQTLINTDNPSETTKTALAKFRKDFLPNNTTQGHHFNLNHLIKAFETYNQNWGAWNWSQRALFWCQVIGYLERLVPVVDAQAFCQGLYYLLVKKQPQSRSLSLYNYQSSSNISYFPSDSTSAGLGFDFGIYVAGARGRGVAGGRGVQAAGVRAGVPAILKTYVEQKHQSLTTFSNTLSSEPTKLTQQAVGNSRCTIL